ncbi:GDNF family receptor alpha-1 [Channa argus]|uniref:GDNF family receptor alpha-1 n=1 Tax=Channa argus TaxID=215402 RepID=A0A6G1QPC2_CHAAH|nr:GDNF family receptor alpha-1 [Channa argus]
MLICVICSGFWSAIIDNQTYLYALFGNNNNLLYFTSSLPDSVFTLKGDSSSASLPVRVDCVKASEQCLKEYSCSTKYRTMRQCVAGRESNFSAVTGPEAQGECRNAIDAMKQSPLYECSSVESRFNHLKENCAELFGQFPNTAEPASTKENNCLNAAKACNLNDTCKKYRSAYINPCTSRVSASEVCNKRKCHKALRQFFDKNTCKTNYICRSRLADFISNCQPEVHSISGCMRENYADCLLSYSGLIGTVMTPNYVRSLGISLSPWCDCTSSGNSKPDCEKFAEFFTNNRCLRNAIQAFGNGTDVGVWQPQPPIQPTVVEPSITRRGKERTSNALDTLTDMSKLDLDGDSLYHICGTLQVEF